MPHELPYDAFLRTIKENRDTDHVFLLGAGASISSGIQSAADCIWEWKKNIFVTKNPSLSRQYNEYKSESIQRSIQKWLDTEGVYPKEGAVDEYTFYALEAYPIDDIRKKYFQNICRNKEPYLGYKLLCLLAKHNIVKSVFTTNFDGLVERAAHQTGVNPISISLDTTDRIHRPATQNELLTIALHGDFKYGPLKNTGEELDTQHETFIGALKQHLYDKHLIVIGYSGRDKSLMEVLKTSYSAPGAGMLFWCGYGHEPSAEVISLLDYIKECGRKAFYVPTEGFDNTLINISQTCSELGSAFEKQVSELLQSEKPEDFVKTSFTIEQRQPNILLKSNLFPVTLPTEIFQFNAPFKEGEKVWATIRKEIGGKKIVAAPLKQMIYAFGIHSQIREAFNSRINGEIKRTPVTYKEIKEGTVFRNIYLSSIIKSLCEIHNLQTDGFEKIYLPSTKRNASKSDIKINIYEAIQIGFFFDSSIFLPKPFAYISIKPTFYLESDQDIPKNIRFEIGKKYHEELLKQQPNNKFSDQIEKWRAILFPQGKIKFEYPPNSGTGFNFAISGSTMNVSIGKINGKYPLQLPSGFNKDSIVHKGIQYHEPYLEVFDANSTQFIKDFHPMRGLVKNKPYDFPLNGNVFDPEINVGIICPDEYKDKVYNFLNRLNSPQSAGAFNPEYLIDYPGFQGAYGIPFNVPATNSDLWKTYISEAQGNNLMASATDLANKIKRCIDKLEAVNKKLVMVIFIPTKLNIITTVDGENEKFDLHDYIKAYAAQKQIATQFLQEETLSDTLLCQVNWWLSLSFYVKSQRTPWILHGLEQNTAFVGIGYSVKRSEGKNKIVLGCSHIYNSLGQGLKYRLSRIEDCIIDKQNNPHMSYQDAYKFGTMIRELFFNTIGDLPKRVVIHKRTHFKPDEMKGIIDSLKKSGINQVDLIEINFEENARFLAQYITGQNISADRFPLSRGTCFVIDNHTALLWTHGIVPSIKAENRSYYLGGKNIPIPLKLKKHYGISNISTIATEILGLTKMNWNSFDLYSKLPTTIQTSNEIARIGWLLNRFEGKTYDYRNFM